MPTYTFKCACTHEQTKFNIPIANRNQVVHCEECGLPMKRKIDFRGAVYAPTSSNGGTLR